VDVFAVFDEHFEVAEGQVFEDEIEILVLGGEDGEEGDYVRVGELLEVLEFADCVRGETFGIFFLNLYLFNCNKF
jgi:hypothetical protein